MVTEVVSENLDTKYGDDMRASVSHFLDNSKLKSNGVREIPKAAYVKALEKHGVSEADVKRVNAAIDFENTAAAHLALQDLEAKISETSADDLGNDEYRRAMQSTVRLPTFGGSTNLTLYAETQTNNPFRKEGEGPATSITYARLKTSINTKGRIHSDFHEQATDRMRKALGVSETVD